MFGFALIAVLAVMGGAIAYIGDILGTKVGKRKLTLFNLRPKHTSIVFTIITGILIAAATISVLALTMQDVRTALFGMEALKTELATLSRDVTVKTGELESSRSALEEKTAEYKVLNEKIKDTTERLASITRELAAVTAERDRAAAQLHQVQNEYALASKEIAELTKIKAELDARVASLSENKATLEADVGRLNDLTEKLGKGIQVIREGAIAFHAGEVIFTAVVAGGKNQDDTMTDLRTVVYNANRLVLERMGLSDKDIEALMILQNDFEQAVSLITSTPEGIIVRISSNGNILYNEPVLGHIELFPNRLVYKQDAVVFTEILTVGTHYREAEELVLAFYQKLNLAAIKDGLLPDPIKGSVGAFSGSQLYETINKVKKHQGGKVQIVALAKKDIFAVGPLEFDILVRKME